MKNRKGIITVGFSSYYGDLSVVLEIEDLLRECVYVTSGYLEDEGSVLVVPEQPQSIRCALTSDTLMPEEEYRATRFNEDE